MASTYTVNLGIEKIGTGEQSGTWGTTTNTNFDLIDQAVNGAVAVTLASAGTSGSPNTLAITNGAASDGRNKFIEFNDGGDLGATAYVQLDPNDAEKIVHMRNSLSGGRSVIVFQGTYNASNDFEIPNGKDVVLKFDGGGASATVTQVFEDLLVTDLAATTVDTTNIEVTNLKAKDGTSAGSIADSTGVVTIASSVLTTVDINGGSVDGVTLGTNSAVTEAQIDNININGNTISSTDTNGNVTITPDGTGSVAITKIDVAGGEIDGTAIGANSASTGAFTTLNATGGGALTGTWTDLGTVTTVDINGGTIDGVTIGGSSAGAGSFTTLSASGLATLSANLKLPASGDIFGGTDTGLNHYTNNYLYIAGGSNGVILKSQGLATEYAKFEAGQTVFNEDSNDTDFRVESDSNTHMLFVNAGSNRVGVGEALPGDTLQLNGGNIVNPNSTGSEITSATFGVGGNIHLEERQPNGAFSDRTDLVIVTNTGFGVGESDKLRLAASGAITTYPVANAETVFNESGVDADFRVESDSTTYALLVDAGGDFVAIGNNTKTPASNYADQHGFAVDALTGATQISSDGTPLEIGRTTTAGGSGTLIQFRAESNVVGYIGTDATELYIGNGDTTLKMDAANNGIFPRGTAGVQRDGAIQLGSAGNRFTDLYLSGGLPGTATGSLVINENGVDSDFRVESDTNANALVIDAGTSTVGINRGVDVNVALSVNSTATNSSTYAFQAANSSNATKFIVRSDGYSAFYKTGNAAGFQIGTGGAVVTTPDVGHDFIINEDSADSDFRVESDTDAHAIFLDAGNNAISLLGGNAPVANSVCIEKDLIVGRTSNTPNFRHDFAGGGYKLSRSGLGPQFFARSGGAATGATDITKIYINDEAAWATVDITGDVDISGALSKGSGSFKIDHPLKPDTHHLVHSFVEAPQADNIYRGKVELVDGAATVNIDTVAGMTEGTFALLNREVQCFTSNESGWTAVRGKVDGNILTIEAQDPACTDTISWLVVGERQDQHMYDTDWTDENGKVVVEPLKETEGA